MVVRLLVMSVIMGFVLAISTLYWAKDTAYTHDDLASIELGWPLKFLVQDFSQLDPPDWWYPHQFGFGMPQEFPIQFLDELSFLLDWTIFTILALTILSILHFISNWQLSRKPIP